MLRVLATIVLPLVLPTAIYLLWVRMTDRSQRGRPVRWTALPWIWLVGAGTALLVIVLFVVNVHFGTSRTGVYVPPRYEHGRVVPPHIAPAPSP